LNQTYFDEGNADQDIARNLPLAICVAEVVWPQLQQPSQDKLREFCFSMKYPIVKYLL